MPNINMVTEEEIERELSNVGDFFVRIPMSLAKDAALRFILEILHWSFEYYDALEVLTKAITELRNKMPDALSKEEEQEIIDENEAKAKEEDEDIDEDDEGELWKKQKE